MWPILKTRLNPTGPHMALVRTSSRKQRNLHSLSTHWLDGTQGAGTPPLPNHITQQRTTHALSCQPPPLILTTSEKSLNVTKFPLCSLSSCVDFLFPLPVRGEVPGPSEHPCPLCKDLIRGRILPVCTNPKAILHP